MEPAEQTTERTLIMSFDQTQPKNMSQDPSPADQDLLIEAIFRCKKPSSLIRTILPNVCVSTLSRKKRNFEAWGTIHKPPVMRKPPGAPSKITPVMDAYLTAAMLAARPTDPAGTRHADIAAWLKADFDVSVAQPSISRYMMAKFPDKPRPDRERPTADAERQRKARKEMRCEVKRVEELHPGLAKGLDQNGTVPNPLVCPRCGELWTSRKRRAMLMAHLERAHPVDVGVAGGADSALN